VRIAALATIMAALFFAGSRPGWIAATLVLAMACYLRVTNMREILSSTAFAGILSAALTAVGSDPPPPAIVSDGVIDPRTPDQHYRRVEIVFGSSCFWRRSRRLPEPDDPDS
jgi:hypothetical protein